MNIRPILVLVTAFAMATTACGGDDSGTSATATTEAAAPTSLAAAVASFDLGADGPQRFMVGLFDGEGQVASFGSVDLAFEFLGTKDDPQPPTPGPRAVASWIPIPGQGEIDPDQEGPRVVAPSEGTGVYEALEVEFDQPGLWRVAVSAEVDGKPTELDATFEVLPESLVVNVGDDAPKTVNHLPGAEGVPPDAIDSRAEDDGTVPDPELHEMTVADAIATGRPTIVTVSTPVYCVSQFCGPITDAVQELAGEYKDRANFVHLEVWRDFEGRAVNKAAAEWIIAEGAPGANEPWVFVVGRDGKILQRWGNVVSDAQLKESIEAAIA